MKKIGLSFCIQILFDVLFLIQCKKNAEVKVGFIGLHLGFRF